MVTTLAKPRPNAKAEVPAIPRLENGDKLTRAEFERRYRAMPDLKKAELIEGVVHMPSPVSLEHAGPHLLVAGWLANFIALTPGVVGGDNATLRLDLDNEPQPDAFAMLDPEHGGQAQISPDNYVVGGPELVIEVAASSVSIDMHKKFEVYRRNGVREYVVWRVQDRAIDWFVLREGAYEPQSVDADGLYRSEVFRGLVMDPAAMVAGDLRKACGPMFPSG